MPRPADPVVQPWIGHNGGPSIDPPALPRWGRAKEAARHYGVGLTTIYAWLNAGRFTTCKIGGIRLLLIGAARGIDIDEHPPPDVVPVSQRPENAGRAWRGRTRQSAVLATTCGNSQEAIGQPTAMPTDGGCG